MRILIMGATGVFGSRLATLLADEPGIKLVLAARDAKKLAAFAEQRTPRADIAVLDRNQITAADLARCGCQCVIDAAGPFQNGVTAVVDAALQAGVHYVDLADGREFVRSFPRFDKQARQKNIAMITGASSIPALSHAVLDDLTMGWQHIKTIKVGVFPGNRAPRGLSVVESILSYTGKAVRVFLDGAWQDVPGWGMTHRVSVPFVGRRWASVCDTPDQDLLVARYRPEISAEFYAGLELSILHLGLLGLSLPVRWGLIHSLRPIAKPLLHIAQLFLALGSDKGGMIVEAAGVDKKGVPQSASWALSAYANHGPYVPTLAAIAVIRKLRDGTLGFHGAGACAGLLQLQDFQPDFDRLGLKTQTEFLPA